MADEIKTLEDFGGWDDSTGLDLFQEAPLEEGGGDTSNIISEVENDDPLKETSAQEEAPADTEETQEDDLFKMGDDEEEAPETNTEEEEETPAPSVGTNVGSLKHLVSSGLIDYEFEEGKELTEQEAEELLEDKFDETIETRIGELFDGMPPVLKNLNKFYTEGGDVTQFFNSLKAANSTGLSADMDLEEESNQETVVRAMLAQEEYDEEYISTQIQFLKDSNKLKSIATKKFDKWKKNNAAAQAALVQQQKDRVKAQKEAVRKAKRETVSFLNDNEEIGGLRVSKKHQRTIPSYMNDRTIQLENGTTISEFQKELFYDLPKNQKAFMQLALLMKNRNEDGTFNFDSIAKKAATKSNQRVKDNVRRNTNVPPKSETSRKARTKKTLADFFND